MILNITRHKDHIIDKINKSKPGSRTIGYSPLQLKDIHGFIGALFLMDIYISPEIKMYWGHTGSLNKLKEISSNMDYKLFVD